MRILFVLALVGLTPTGCSRQHYRQDADKEVYDLLNTVDECNPLWKMDNFSLNSDYRSRYSDFHDQDAQPMPQDDATAHRLMECVDGKKGYKKWLKNGVVDQVDNENWRQSLPAPTDGEIVVDSDIAFDLALLHSPEYRTSFENVYSSALTVTAQRFAYDVKFYGGDSLFYNNRGGFRRDSVSTLTNDIGPGSRASNVATKQFATGGELVVGLANSMVWTFGPNGSQDFSPTTTLSYGFVQPFLRGAGRAIVLESLTQSERVLLANVRQLAFYQQGFYVSVLTGGTPVRQPGTSGYPTRGVSSISISSTGFYGLLSNQVQIRNQQSNVISLQDNLNRYEELFKAGRVSERSDVDRVRQSLLNGQSTLISQKNTYRNNVDSFLVNIGLPPNIDNLVIRDPLLDQFVLMPERLTDVTKELDEILAILRDNKKEIPSDIGETFKQMLKKINSGEEEVVADIKKLRETVYPLRTKAALTLSKRLKEDHPEIDSTFCAPASLDKKLALIVGDYDRDKKELDDFGNERKKGVKWVIQDIFRLLELTVGTYDRPTLTKMLEETRKDPGASPFSQEVIDLVYELQLDQLLVGDSSQSYDSNIEKQTFTGSEGLDDKTKKELAERFGSEIERETNKLLGAGGAKDDVYRIWIRDCLSRFSDELMTLRLVQARARLETLDLAMIDIKAEDGFAIAAEHRLDWMNARSILVDNWRNMEIVANQLKGYMSVSMEGSIQNEGSNPLNFSAKNARFSTGVQFDAPLTRLLERNSYRQALISYDQARRTYYNYVDTINAQVRSTIRAIQLSQMNFELQRENVLTAIQRVQQSQLKLAKPPTASNIGSLTTSAAQDLVDSLSDLLTAQNNLMSTWLTYRAQRMGLLLVLGVFEIDERGRWKDPGDITTDYLRQLGGAGTSQDTLSGVDKLPGTTELTGGVPLEQLPPPKPDDEPAGVDPAAIHDAGTVPANAPPTLPRLQAKPVPTNTRPELNRAPQAPAIPNTPPTIPNTPPAIPNTQPSTTDRTPTTPANVAEMRNSTLGETRALR